MKPKFYTPMQVGIGAFVGGPLAGCWLISANYRTIGDKQRASRFLCIGIVSTVLIVLLLTLIPEGDPFDWLTFVATVSTVTLCSGYAKHIQAVTLNSSQKQSYIRTFMVSFTLLLGITGIAIFCALIGSSL